MFSKQTITSLALSAGVLLSAGMANAAMIHPGAIADAKPDVAPNGNLVLVGNDKYLMRQQRHDAFTKHNPNAAALGQMMGGARSIDIPGGFGLSPRHYAWCYRQYGSYKIRDNTFVDFDGTRQTCQSPYLAQE